MDSIKQKNLERLQQEYSGKGGQSIYSQKDIILDFLNRNPDQWYLPWVFQGQFPLGWLGIQARRRVQELKQEGKILSAKVGKYTAYSAK